MAAAKSQIVERKTHTRGNYINAVGRRKEAVARVRLHETVQEGMMWGKIEIKKGDIVVNEKMISEYFPGEVNRFKYTEPLRVANAQNKYTITISVSGGGPAGQLDAVVNGLAHALANADSEAFKPALRKQGLLTRDARVRERRKVGTGGKARRKKQSPKR